MLDKSNAIKMISKVLKREIIPNLSDEMAKEQAIAMISLLKNLDATTIQNNEPYLAVTTLLLKELEVLIDEWKNEPLGDDGYDSIQGFEKTFILLKNQQDGERNKWEALNQLFCKIIHFVYHHPELDSYKGIIREIIRKQLALELRYVH